MCISKIRTFFQLALFFMLTNVLSQNNYLRIELKPIKEHRITDYHFYKNDSLIYANCGSISHINWFSNLEKGEYRLKYDTVFGIDSVEFSFTSDRGSKKIILETEKTSKKRLAETHSYVESLKNNERITLNYSLGACFISRKKEATILKENDLYYFIDYGQKRLISERRIKRIIRHEKILKNLNFTENIHDSELYVTCSEFFSLTKNGKQVYGKNVYCGTWSESSNIKRYMR